MACAGRERDRVRRLECTAQCGGQRGVACWPSTAALGSENTTRLQAPIATLQRLFSSLQSMCSPIARGSEPPSSSLPPSRPPCCCSLLLFSTGALCRFQQSCAALLSGDPRPPLTFEQRLSIARQVARAIQHLHSKTPPTLHKDIKSATILLDGNFQASPPCDVTALSCARFRCTPVPSCAVAAVISTRPSLSRKIPPPLPPLSSAPASFPC